MAQCPSRRTTGLCGIKSTDNYDAISLRSVLYAKNRYDTEARRSKLFTLLTPSPGGELAGNIATT